MLFRAHVLTGYRNRALIYRVHGRIYERFQIRRSRVSVDDRLIYFGGKRTAVQLVERCVIDLYHRRLNNHIRQRKQRALQPRGKPDPKNFPKRFRMDFEFSNIQLGFVRLPT